MKSLRPNLIKKKSLLIASVLLAFVGSAPAAVIWSDDFAGASGAGSDTTTFSNASGGFAGGSVTPTGDSNTYSAYWDGATSDSSAWSMTLTAQQSAVGTSAGLVWTNSPNTGNTITTFGGLGSQDLNLATLTGWTPGAFTLSEIQSIVFTFNYRSDNYANGFGALIGIGANNYTNYSSTNVGQSAGNPVDIGLLSAGDQANFLSQINAANGIIHIGFYYPGSTDAPGTSFAVSDLALSAAAVPEPGAWAMVAGGFGILFGFRPRAVASLLSQ